MRKRFFASVLVILLLFSSMPTAFAEGASLPPQDPTESALPSEVPSESPSDESSTGLSALNDMTEMGDETLTSGVQLDKHTLLLRPGQTTTLQATVSPDSAVVKDVTWSSNSNIAWVQNGVVTAGPHTGNAVITVKTLDGGFTDICEVRVEPEQCTVYFDSAKIFSVTVPYGSSITEPYVPMDMYQKCFCGWYPTPECNTSPLSFPLIPTEETTRIYAKWESPNFTGASGDYQYWVKNGAATITGYTGFGGAITIPSALDGYPVQAIGVGVFRDSSVTDVTIPDGINAIGMQAFSSCMKLQTVRLPRGLKVIEDETFNYCPNMRSVVIPDGVTHIGQGAFGICCEMVDVTIPASVTNIDNNAFLKCGRLEKAYFKGNAPTLGGPLQGISPDGTSVFKECAANFTVYYQSGNTGFTNPWYGYKTDIYTPDTAYRIHYVTYDSSSSGIPDTYASYGATISAPQVTAKRGNYFVGWYPTLACNTPQVQFPYTVYGETTFYSKWALSPAYLENISLSVGSLNRAFFNNVYSYKILLGENEPSITLTAAKQCAGATMTINGRAVSSYSVSLANGKSATITVKVKYGKTSKTYKFAVTRAKSSDNSLASLSASAGTFDRPFDPNVTTYTLTLDESTKSVKISDSVANPMAKASFKTKAVSLNNGQTKKLVLTVKAQSGARRTYTIIVTRAASTDAGLKSLKTSSGLSPAFNPGVTDYTVTLPANRNAVTISAKALGYKAAVYIDGAKKASKKVTLANGQSVTVRVTVVAQAGNTREYTVTISRP